MELFVRIHTVKTPVLTQDTVSLVLNKLKLQHLLDISMEMSKYMDLRLRREDLAKVYFSVLLLYR